MSPACFDRRATWTGQAQFATSIRPASRRAAPGAFLTTPGAVKSASATPRDACGAASTAHSHTRFAPISALRAPGPIRRRAKEPLSAPCGLEHQAEDSARTLPSAPRLWLMRRHSSALPACSVPHAAPPHAACNSANPVTSSGSPTDRLRGRHSGRALHPSLIRRHTSHRWQDRSRPLRSVIVHNHDSRRTGMSASRDRSSGCCRATAC